MDDAPQRIAKVMARAGVCSRRDAERWIADKRVQVNGIVLESPAVCVTSGDQILVDGNPLPTTPTVNLWLYHKPKGLVTTHNDPEGRPTVFQSLPRHMPRVISVGRLDQNSEGLLLLTNDGALARFFELPKNAFARLYKVRVFGKVEEARLHTLAQGVSIDGVTYGAIHTRVVGQKGDNTWIEMTLHEGKNREIRRVMSYLGYPVNRLIRLSYGPFTLGDLKAGEITQVPYEDFKAYLSYS